MEIRRKPTALGVAAAFGVWELFLKPIWTLNVERLAEKERIDTALSGGGRMMDALSMIASYVPSSFGLGFVVGALLFAYWDVISAFVKTRILRREVPADIRAWVGNIVPRFGNNGFVSLHVYLISVGETPFIIDRMEGHIKFTFDDGTGKRRTVELPTPVFNENPALREVLTQGFYCLLELVQPVPRDVERCFFDTFTWKPYPSFDFEDLNISLVSENRLTTKRLKLWDSLRLSAGETVVRSDQTTRLFSSDAEAQAFRETMLKVASLGKS